VAVDARQKWAIWLLWWISSISFPGFFHLPTQEGVRGVSLPTHEGGNKGVALPHPERREGGLSLLDEEVKHPQKESGIS